MGMNTTSGKRFVGYVRVSTTEQGTSGLGLEAQEHAIRQHVASVEGELVRVVSEIASGDDDDRQGLADALKLAKRLRAVLIVSKLDRLSRAVAMIAGVMRSSGVPLCVAECSGASTLELHVRAIVAQEEREKIGQRTRDALAAAKRRGVRLGSARPGHWHGKESRRRAGAIAGSAAAAEARREMRADVYAQAGPVAATALAAGKSLRNIASELNAAGITTPMGGQWQAQSVKRLLTATVSVGA
jgi:DNA invertase Pin-like site-specific DNA recombinase